MVPVALDWQTDERSWFSDDAVTYTNLTVANGYPYDLNIRADLQTVIGEVISVSLDSNTWDIGSIVLSGSSVSPSYTATNDGNVAIDLTIKATDGAGGWTLAPAAGANAFRVAVTSPALNLSTSDQSLATNVGVAGTQGIDMTYNAPTSDTYGESVDQQFTVTVSATKYVAP